MGIPALVLYFSLVGSVAYMVISTALTSKPIVKMLLIGLASGLLAHLVYGLFDNYLPGEKLGAVMWVYFGVTTAFYIHRESFAVAEVDGRSYSYSSTGIKISQWLIIFFIGLISWIMISLIAITFINREPIISLIVAALGGVTFGLLTTRKFGLSMFTKTAVGLHF